MDKKLIEKFAVKARQELIESVRLKLSLIGIDENGVNDKLPESTNEVEIYTSEGNKLSGQDISRRKSIVSRLNQLAGQNDWKTAYGQFIEEVAYTWFNQIIAIRFMEVNRYLPSGVRVLSSDFGHNDPDIIHSALDIEDDLGGYTDDERKVIQQAHDSQLGPDLDAAYKVLFLKQVDALNKNLPVLFEKTKDYLKLLFTPKYATGVIHELVTEIPESDFDIQQGGQVEIIGWLYQYYNEEPHDKVVNINGGAVKEADLPAATQLFTTDWVVRYMIDNSLGKYYLERVSNSSIKKDLKFLLPGEITHVDEPLDMTKIKVLDDAMGSGHILVYAFDVLMKMYLEQGYSRREAAKSIVENNLFGLEIDQRAYQLSYFAVMMKLREFDRRALDTKLDLNLFVFKNIPVETSQMIAELKAPKSIIQDLQDILANFQHAQLFGSVMHFDKQYDLGILNQAIVSLNDEKGLDLFGKQEQIKDLHNALRIVGVLQQKYEILATNPPYLNRMDSVLKKYVKKYYADYSKDLFSIFIWKNNQMTIKNGYSAYMTPFVWMFIKTYEKLRTQVLSSKQISSLIQMEYSAFEEATVPINTFVLKNDDQNRIGTYVKLSDFKGGMSVQETKVLDAIADPEVDYLYHTDQSNFTKIPGSPIAYWASKNLIHDFEVGTPMSELVDPKVGLQTGDNNKFLRQWFEVDINKIKFDATSVADSVASRKKWFPYNKGGAYRKWYGNYDYVVNWENDGQEIRNFKGPNGKVRSVTRNPNYYFREAITWSDVTSGKFAARYRGAGSIHDVTGMSAFPTMKDNAISLAQILALLNSKVANYIFKTLNPTIHLQIGNFSNFPVINEIFNQDVIGKLARKQILISKNNWDSFETSWEFKVHPLASRNFSLIQNAYKNWNQDIDNIVKKSKENEETLNRIFINLYGLQTILKPQMSEKDVSIKRSDLQEDVKSLLSYFIGVTFGRYSLNQPGLTYAGGQWDVSKYQLYKPNNDNVIVLTDNDYFGNEHDIIYRFKEFLTEVYGQEHLIENMVFIADTLGKRKANVTPEQQIRDYFFNDFYKKDHVKTYRKRPIYWEINSGRQGGFRALIYLHRYDENMMATIRISYLHPLQAAYENKLTQIKPLLDSETSTKSQHQLQKQVDKITKQLDELIKFDAKLQHVANMHIKIDLDDGVVVNHEKVQGGENILSPIK